MLRRLSRCSKPDCHLFCESLNILHVGTVGLLVSANRFGLIPSLRIALLQVRNAGLYIGDELFDSLIAGEHDLNQDLRIK